MQRYNSLYSALYDWFMKTNGFSRTPPRLVDALRQAAAGRIRPGKILDFGCGTGLLTSAFLEKCGRGFFIKGIDPNEPMLKEYAEKFEGADNISHAVGGYCAEKGLAEKSGEYGVVMAAGVLDHIEITGRLAREFMRVVTPGGYLAFTYERHDGGEPVKIIDEGDTKFYLHGNKHVRRTFENAGGKVLRQFDAEGYRRYSDIFEGKWPRKTRYGIMIVQKHA